MATNGVPIDLDWVTARSECSLYKMFKELRNGVKNDVEIRNRVGAQHSEQVLFELGAESSKSFSVFRTLNGATESIDFTFETNGIHVSDGGQQAVSATIAVNAEGRCKFIVEGQELEQWQVRSKVLEKFFFYK